MLRRCALVLVFLMAAAGLSGVGRGASGPGELKPLRPNASEIEERVFAAINRERIAHGLPQLARAQDLAAVAREHSRDMMARRYFAHRSPEGTDLRHRFARSGIHRWRLMAENIACNLGFQDPVSTAVEGWMQSPSHRRNILDRRLTESGVGVAVDNSGRVYFTQVFATRDQSVVARAW
jgi:uncharacterized protein YkwD